MRSHSTLFTVLVVLFSTALIVSNIIAGKLYAAPFGAVLTAGVWLFPIVYIIGDVVPEVYGLAAAQRMIALGFIANLFAVAFFGLTLFLPYPPFWTGQAAFESVLGFTPRLLAASAVGYLLGTNANALTLIMIKRATAGRWLWLRTIGSTIVGESIDTIAFITIAFYGVLPTDALPMMIAAQALFKIAYEAAMTPFTYAIVNAARTIESRLSAAAVS